MTDDGWTHVAKSKKSRPPKAVDRYNPPSRDITIGSIRTEFLDKTKTWEDSDSWKSLSALFARIRPDEGWKLRRAVCLGSGSLSRDNVDCRRRSMWQMAVFVEIAKSCGIEKLYAQDPEFTSLDKSFLSTFGVEVLEMSAEEYDTNFGESTGTYNYALGPAEEVLGPDTLLFEPFLDIGVRMVHAMVQKDVGLYIGSSIEGLLERGMRLEAIAKTWYLERPGKYSEAVNLAKRFAEGRGVQQFPNFDPDPNTFNGLLVYWKEEKDSDEDN